MKTALIFSSFFIASFPALAGNNDKDGVPIVDIHGTIVVTTDAKAIAHAKEWGVSVPSKRMINLNGTQISLKDFLLTYCQGKYQNETCVRGSKILLIDSSSGPKKELPKGL